MGGFAPGLGLVGKVERDGDGLRLEGTMSGLAGRGGPTLSGFSTTITSSFDSTVISAPTANTNTSLNKQHCTLLMMEFTYPSSAM